MIVEERKYVSSTNAGRHFEGKFDFTSPQMTIRSMVYDITIRTGVFFVFFHCKSDLIGIFTENCEVCEKCDDCYDP